MVLRLRCFLRLLALGSHGLFAHGALGLLGLLLFALAAQLLCLALGVRRDLRLDGLRGALGLFGRGALGEGAPWPGWLSWLSWLDFWRRGARARHLCVGGAMRARRRRCRIRRARGAGRLAGPRT